MGEGTTAAWASAPKRLKSGSDKRRRNRLVELSPEAEEALFAVAKEVGQAVPLVLLTKYYLRPEQVATCQLDGEGLVVEGFERRLGIDEADREALASWLSRPRRARSAQAVRNLLGDLRKKVVARLESSRAAANTSTDWAGLLDIGVVALRRMAAERHAEACGFEEQVFRDLLHDETADPCDVLRRLSRPARRILAEAAAAIVDEVHAASEHRETGQ